MAKTKAEATSGVESVEIIDPGVLEALTANEAVITGADTTLYSSQTTIASALLAIKNGKLYKAQGHSGFQAYLEANKDRWTFSRQWAYRLMAEKVKADKLAAGETVAAPVERGPRILSAEDAAEKLGKAWDNFVSVTSKQYDACESEAYKEAFSNWFKDTSNSVTALIAQYPRA